MFSRFFLIVTLSLLSAETLVRQQVASAETPLTKATVQALRNQVQLIFKDRVTRAARTADTMTPGDSLATARRSFAELRFNDSSLARIGERALFQFIPSTRNFYLGNGTALLLIPPRQGRTNVRTPNAAAGIRGSALFVRYNEDTNTTIVGALTNSRIEVSNGENAQAQTLKAGQMAVIVQNQIVQVYNFDLHTFYQTSDLVKDLDLPLSNAAPNADPGIAAVQAETSQAAREQAPLIGQVYENPAFVSLGAPSDVRSAVAPDSKIPTPTLSGLDLGVAGQTITPSTPSTPSTSVTSVSQPAASTPQAGDGGLTAPDSNPNTTPAASTLTQPSQPRPAPVPTAGFTTSAPQTQPPTSSAPITGLQPTPLVPAAAPITVTPAPTTGLQPITPVPAAAPVYVTPITATPTPTTGLQPTTPAPAAAPITATPAPVTGLQPTTLTPIAAPVNVAPITATPTPITGLQPTTPAPAAAPVNTTPITVTPAPTTGLQPATPAPTAAPVNVAPIVNTTPAPRPAPVAVPAIPPTSPQLTPVPSTPGADKPAAQPAVPPQPAVATPTPTVKIP